MVFPNSLRLSRSFCFLIMRQAFHDQRRKDGLHRRRQVYAVTAGEEPYHTTGSYKIRRVPSPAYLCGQQRACRGVYYRLLSWIFDQVATKGQFLPWHRWFLTLFEKALREECSYTGGHPFVLILIILRRRVTAVSLQILGLDVGHRLRWLVRSFSYLVSLPHSIDHSLVSKIPLFSILFMVSAAMASQGLTTRLRTRMGAIE